MIERSRVRLLASAPPGNNSRQVANTHVPLSPSSTIWYRPKVGDALLPGLASHWPCGTDFSGLSTYGLMTKVSEMSTPPMPIRAWSALPYLYLYLSWSWWLGIIINLYQLRAILLICLKVLSLFKNSMPFLLGCVTVYDIYFVVFLCLLGKKQASEDSAVGSWSTV